MLILGLKGLIQYYGAKIINTMSSHNGCLFCEQFSSPVNTATQPSVEVKPSVICEVIY